MENKTSTPSTALSTPMGSLDLGAVMADNQAVHDEASRLILSLSPSKLLDNIFDRNASVKRSMEIAELQSALEFNRERRKTALTLVRAYGQSLATSATTNAMAHMVRDFTNHFNNLTGNLEDHSLANLQALEQRVTDIQKLAGLPADFIQKQVAAGLERYEQNQKDAKDVFVKNVTAYQDGFRQKIAELGRA